CATRLAPPAVDWSPPVRGAPSPPNGSVPASLRCDRLAPRCRRAAVARHHNPTSEEASARAAGKLPARPTKKTTGRALRSSRSFTGLPLVEIQGRARVGRKHAEAHRPSASRPRRLNAARPHAMRIAHTADTAAPPLRTLAAAPAALVEPPRGP